MNIKAIIGLGNPGSKYKFNRHNIGYMVVDYIAQQQGAQWQETDILAHCSVMLTDKTVLLVKPLTFMNSSGRIATWLQKRGIGVGDIVVIHDELDFPFGKVAVKCGGSARGHNGVRSLIEQLGADFCRIRCGVDRPANKEEVANYVLSNFAQSQLEIDELTARAAASVQSLLEDNGNKAGV
jgi:PTH1 family peptidyl-tRNA hydrolase